MNKTLAATKNYIVRNQNKLLGAALIVTTTACVTMKLGLVQHDTFLKEHDLFEKFYNIEA